MIQDTSQKAFREEVVPTMSERHGQVIAVLEQMGEATNSEIAYALNWSINRVTPRIFELRERRIVVEIGKRPCKMTGRLAYVWTLASQQKSLL